MTEEDMTLPQQTEPQKEEPKKEEPKFQKALKSFDSQTRDIIAYVLMIAGIVLLFSQPWIGGLIIGIVAGLYFAKELMHDATSVNEIIEKQGMVRSLIFGGLLIALFISAPAIFLGAAIGVGLKHILYPEAT